MLYIAYVAGGLFEQCNSKEAALRAANNEFVNDSSEAIYILEVGASDLVEAAYVLEAVDTLVSTDAFVGEDVDML